MKDGKKFVERFISAADLRDEAIPGMPLIEIFGDRRGLIEQHCGVTEDECKQIGVRVKNGRILVLGERLQLALMTKEQLVISGCIEAVRLLRRGE